MHNMVAAAAALALLSASAPALAASARFVDAEGNNVGSATLDEVAQGVVIHAELQGLSEGWHGFHIHESGRCEPPGFKSAGGHFNPDGGHHGFKDEAGSHAGDLPNIHAAADGTARVEMFIDQASLSGEGGILDDDGAAIVVHAGADDYRSDPSGASGARIACAVIQR